MNAKCGYCGSMNYGLEMLSCYSGKPFYVFQATDEDWMGAIKQEQAVKDKIDHNKRQQESDISDFISDGLSAQGVSEHSLRRLNEYKDL